MSDVLATEARELIDRRKVYDEARQAKTKAEARKNEQERKVHDILTKQGVKTVTLDLGQGYGSVQLGARETIYPRIIDLDTALDAMDERALTDEITQTTLRKAPLGELVRECLDHGQPLPEGIDFSRTQYIQVTRRKAKK